MQERKRSRSPRQKRPPLSGAGREQKRCEELTPPPQLREQALHGAHGPQAPSTGIWGEKHREPDTGTHLWGAMGKSTL